MDETTQKVKFSKMAIVSFVLGLISVVMVIDLYHFTRAPRARETVFSLIAHYDIMVGPAGMCLYFGIPALAILCAIVAGVIIAKSPGILAGANLKAFGWGSGLFVIAALVLFPSHICYVVTTRAEICIENLDQIDEVKSRWAKNSNATNGTIVTWAQLTPYFPKGQPSCPDEGNYEINPIGIPSRCSIDYHNDRFYKRKWGPNK